jgi:hypothetical protein
MDRFQEGQFLDYDKFMGKRKLYCIREEVERDHWANRANKINRSISIAQGDAVL